MELRGNDIRHVVSTKPTPEDEKIVKQLLDLAEGGLRASAMDINKSGDTAEDDPPTFIIWGDPTTKQGCQIMLARMENDDSFKQALMDTMREKVAKTENALGVIMAMPAYMRVLNKHPNEATEEEYDAAERVEKIMLYVETKNGAVAQTTMLVTRDNGYELGPMAKVEYQTQGTESALIDFFDRFRTIGGSVPAQRVH